MTDTLHLKNRNGYWYFRRRLPTQKYHVVSLKTKSLREAQKKRNEINERWDDVIGKVDRITLVEKEINNKKIKIVWNKKHLRSVGTYIDGDPRPFIFITTRYELGPNTAFDMAMSQLKATKELLLI